MSHLLATPHGLTLAGVILAKRNPNGSFAITDREKVIHAQLQAAYGRPIPPQAMRYIQRGCELLAHVSDEELENASYPFHPNPHASTHRGDDFSTLAKGLMMFALTGLNDMDGVIAGKERLLKMQRSLRPDGLLKSYGLPTWEELTKDADDDSDEDDNEDDDSGDDSAYDGGDNAGGGNGHYNPDEPRIPAGQPGGGQWTTGGSGTSTDPGSISADDVRTALREDFDNYDPSTQPQGTDVAANDTVQSDATSSTPNTLKAVPLISPTVGSDGSMNSLIQWKLSSPSPSGGIIVQEVNATVSENLADGTPINQTPHFWEVWEVPAGSDVTNLISDGQPYDDHIGGKAQPTGSSGTITVQTSARFYEGIYLSDLNGFESFNPDTLAHALPSSTTDPKLPTNDATPPVERYYYVKWPFARNYSQ